MGTPALSHLAPSQLTPADITFTATPAEILPIQSGSKWRKKHLDVFKIVVKHDIPLQNIVPSQYLLTAQAVLTNPDYTELFSGTEAELRAMTMGQLRREFPKTQDFFKKLKRLLDRGSGSSINADSREKALSSSDEDTDESVSERAMLGLLGWLTEESMPDHRGWSYELQWRDEKQNVNLLVLNQDVTVINDGYLGLSKIFPTSQSDVRDWAGIFIKAKRRTHNKTNENLDGQLGAEFLAAVKHNYRGGAANQEVFAFGIHHRSVTIMHSHIPQAYINQLSSGQQPSSHVVIKRSNGFSLADPDARLELARQYLGIIEYIKSGNPMVGKAAGWGR
ncbi:hypothetical protein HDV00_011106 [Rhizophlyctis rosea]|nr:hypothetical protein HDV00_011106 [Rhizophlyctis rosea]